jgi:hypothetical protein
MNSSLISFHFVAFQLLCSPSQCLTRYLIGQKPVTLLPSPRDQAKLPKSFLSHLILLQGKFYVSEF